MSHPFQNVKIDRDDATWEASITAELPAEILAKYRERALKNIQKTAQLDGFRQGHAPIDRIVQVYGESQIMRQAAEDAIHDELPHLLAEEKVPIVEAPKVTTGAPENGKPLSFTARAALAPEITLGDYQGISKKHRDVVEDTSVSDKEHQEAMLHLRRERARIDKMESGSEPQKAGEEAKAMAEADLPALDDAFVQSLGYENTAAFSDALRKNIQTEKELRASEKRRAGILDDLVKDSTMSFPAALIQYEIDEMEARLTDDLARIGQTLDAYLKQTKKTKQELRDSWKEAADKRARVRLILAEVAKREKLEPDAEALEHEVGHAREHYPDADPDGLRMHIAHAMRNEMTLRFLEGNTEKVGHTAHDH